MPETPASGPGAGPLLADLLVRVAEGGAPCTRTALASVAAGVALTARSLALDAGDGEDDGPFWSRGRVQELDALRTTALERLAELDDARERAAAPAGDDEARRRVEKARRRLAELPIEAMEIAVAALRILAVAAPDLPAAAGAVGAAAARLLASVATIGRPDLDRALADVDDGTWADRHRMAADALGAEASALDDEVRRETETENA